MRRMIRTAMAGGAVVLLVGGCGGDAPDPGAAEQPEELAELDPVDADLAAPDLGEPDAAELDLDEFDPDDLDAALDDMRAQLEELGREAEEFEVDLTIQDDDRPLLLPAEIVLTGGLSGTYTDVPGCDAHESNGGAQLRILFGGAGKSFDWTGDAPDESGGRIRAAVFVDEFTGTGSYTGELDIGRVEPVAAGSVQVTIEELRRESFPTYDLLVLTGTVEGSYAGSAGSGEIKGAIGVCSVPAP